MKCPLGQLESLRGAVVKSFGSMDGGGGGNFWIQATRSGLACQTRNGDKKTNRKEAESKANE